MFFVGTSALWLFVLGTMTLGVSCAYCGLLIYATYHDCDPLTTQLAKAKDQLLPLLVMRLFGDYPGLPGLFVSGVFSAALRFIPQLSWKISQFYKFDSFLVRCQPDWIPCRLWFWRTLWKVSSKNRLLKSKLTTWCDLWWQFSAEFVYVWYF